MKLLSKKYPENTRINNLIYENRLFTTPNPIYEFLT